MHQKTKPEGKKIPYIVLSVLLAIALWFYVVSQENPDIPLDFNGISVTFQGENDALKAKNLMITAGHGASVNLTLEGKRNALLALDNSKIVVTVDVSSITEPGDYSLSYKVTFPTASGIRVLKKSRDLIDVTVSKVTAKAVPVEGVFNGSILDGYLAEDFVFYPDTVEISGIDEDIELVSHALVTLTGEDVSATIEKDAAFQLIDFRGNVIESKNIKASQPTVHVTLPVVTTAEIPLSLELLAGGGATAENVLVSISPKSILVSGEPDDLKALKSIALGTLDLAKVLQSGVYGFPIPLSAGLVNQSGITEAEVTVSITGLASKTLVATNIEVIDAPRGYQAVPVTLSLPVMVRGTEEALAAIYDYNIRIVVDLSDIKEATGDYTLPAKVYLDGYGNAGVVGEYKVVVSISK